MIIARRTIAKPADRPLPVSDLWSALNTWSPRPFPPIKGVTIFSESKNKDGNLSNIYLKKETNNKNFQITFKNFFVPQKIVFIDIKI